jgi:hypothetical protein
VRRDEFFDTFRALRSSQERVANPVPQEGVRIWQGEKMGTGTIL